MNPDDPDGNLERQRQALVHTLSTMAAEDIEAFSFRLRDCWADAYRWDLWGAAYVIGHGCSEDGFSDFRAWVISLGRQPYEEALQNPESLLEPATSTDVEDVFFEGFLRVPAEAYERSFHKSLPAAPAAEPTAPTGKRWKDDENLRTKFPKLWARFRRPR